VDFYSGFVYDMLNIPMDLYTPLFAISRVVGWCAHRLEELVNGGPIVRPAFKALTGDVATYAPLAERNA
jgi:citrate synthase